jgi:hypothetical protein
VAQYVNDHIATTEDSDPEDARASVQTRRAASRVRVLCEGWRAWRPLPRRRRPLQEAGGGKARPPDRGGCPLGKSAPARDPPLRGGFGAIRRCPRAALRDAAGIIRGVLSSRRFTSPHHVRLQWTAVVRILVAGQPIENYFGPVVTWASTGLSRPVTKGTSEIHIRASS